MNHHGVAEAAVVGAADETTGQGIVAFVILREGVENTGDVLIAELKAQVSTDISPIAKTASDHDRAGTAEDPVRQDHAPPPARRRRRPRPRRHLDPGRPQGVRRDTRQIGPSGWSRQTAGRFQSSFAQCAVDQRLKFGIWARVSEDRAEIDGRENDIENSFDGRRVSAVLGSVVIDCLLNLVSASAEVGCSVDCRGAFVSGVQSGACRGQRPVEGEAPRASSPVLPPRSPSRASRGEGRPSWETGFLR